MVDDSCILVETDDYLVINKPEGLLTHAKPGSDEDSVASWHHERLNIIAADPRELVVHRLDRLTSGVLLLAKHEKAYSFFQQQFKDRRVQKKYRARVHGVELPKRFTVDAALKRSGKHDGRFIVDSRGRAAKTEGTVLSTDSVAQHTELELRPETGRTHQLRVHLQYIKHPIVGDPLYSGSVQQRGDYTRMYLHAMSLRFFDLDEKPVEISSDTPW